MKQGPAIGKWNAELLRMAGVVARLQYDRRITTAGASRAAIHAAMTHSLLEETKGSPVGPLLRQVGVWGG